MNIKISLFLTFVLLCVLACARSASKMPPSPYAPKEEQGIGVVVYNPSGLKDIVDMRKKDAYWKIYTACGNSNDYKIIKEETRELDHFDSESFATAGATKLTYLYYQCKK